MNGPDQVLLEVFNGAVLALCPLPGANLTVTAPAQWSQPLETPGGVEVDLLMAVDAAGERYGRTIVTVNGVAWEPFDPRMEWVVLPGQLDGPQEIVAAY